MSSPSREGIEEALPAAASGNGEWPHDGTGPEGHRSRRRRWLAGAALALVAVAVVVVVLAASGSSSHDTGGSVVPAGERTTEVTRRTLTESSTVDGTLGYGTTLELYDRLAGTFTWLPSVGAVIERGGTLFKVDDLPIVLMYGDVPAYRTLKEGVSDGPDVTELNQNLIALGFDPYGEIDDDEVFSAATAAAVRRWQKADGLTETGEVELGRVVFAPSARRVTDVHVGLGQDPPGSDDESGDPGTSGDDEATKPESPSAKAAAVESPGKESPGKESPGKKSPSKKSPSKKPQRKKSPSSKSPSSSKSPDSDADDKDEKEPEGDKGSKEPEGGSGAGELTLSTTSTQQLVQLKLKAEQQQLARVGEHAPVTLPGGGVVEGRITEVGSVASESKGNEGEKGANESGESATIPVTLVIDKRLPRLDDAPVSVELVKAIRHDVLTVPATALTATGADSYAVWVLEGKRRVALPVTPGMFANGYVQIEGAGVHEGLTVLESE
jgi:peptidoglycan hydrolase-like protein with peptidoglycan-binding domain